MPLPRALRRLALVAGALLALLVVVGVGAALGVRALLDSDLLRGALASQAGAALGQPVAIASARAQLFPRVGLRLAGVAVGSPPRLSAERVDVSTDLRGLLSRRIDEAELVVSGARVELPLPELAAAGPAPGPATGAGGIAVGSVRALRLEDVSVVAGGRTLRADVAASLQGERLEVSSLRLRSPRSEIEGSAALASWRALEGSFALSARTLDLDELLDLAARLAPPAEGEAAAAAKAKAAAPLARRLEGTVRAARGTYRGVEFRDLDAKAVVAGTRVALAPMTMALLDGTYAGELRVDLGSRAQRVDYRGKLARVDVARLGAAFGHADAARGRLSADLEVRGSGPDLEQALLAARGRGDVRLEEGQVRQLDLVHSALAFLGAARPAGAEGGRFTSLVARVTLADGRLQAQELAMAAPDFDLRGRGSFVLGGALDLGVELVLSPELSALASGSAFDYAREGGRLVLPMRIGGTLESPRVTVDAQAAAKRAGTRAVEKAAGSLLDRVFGGKGK